LSDKSVLTFMRYAWDLVPNKFTTPAGKVIEVDKSKPSENLVPVDVAREIIRVARLSALAEICDLAEEQTANFQTMMRREQAKGTWTEQQLLFINQLHLMTVMLRTGKVALVETNGQNRVQPSETKPAQTEKCSEPDRKKVQAQIMAYVTSNPPPASAAAAPAATTTPGK